MSLVAPAYIWGNDTDNLQPCKASSETLIDPGGMLNRSGLESPMAGRDRVEFIHVSQQPRYRSEYRGIV